MDKLFKKLSNIRLKIVDKQQMRDNLHDFMLVNSVRKDNLDRRIYYQEKKSIFNLLLTSKYMFTSIALAIFLAISGGVSYAANDALPGEVLYPFKVNVNEEVKATFIFDGEKKADWEIERYTRRLNEVIELSNKNELNNEQKIKLQSNLDKHQERIEKLVSKKKEQGDIIAAVSIQSSLEARLEAYQKVFANWEKNDLESLLEKVSSDQLVTIQARADSQMEFSSNTNDMHEEFVKNYLETVKQDFNKAEARVRESLSAEQSKTNLYVQTRLKIANSLIVEAEAQYNQNTYREAYLILQKAHKVIKEALALLNINNILPFDLNIGASINMETQIEEEIEIENYDNSNNTKKIIIESDGKVKIESNYLGNGENHDADASGSDDLSTQVKIKVNTKAQVQSGSNDTDDEDEIESNEGNLDLGTDLNTNVNINLP